MVVGLRSNSVLEQLITGINSESRGGTGKMVFQNAGKCGTETRGLTLLSLAGL